MAQGHIDNKSSIRKLAKLLQLCCLLGTFSRTLCIVNTSNISATVHDFQNIYILSIFFFKTTIYGRYNWRAFWLIIFLNIKLICRSRFLFQFVSVELQLFSPSLFWKSNHYFLLFGTMIRIPFFNNWLSYSLRLWGCQAT